MARPLAVTGWLLGVGVALLVGWVAPDQGATTVTIRQGLGLGAIYIVVGVVAWIWPRSLLVLGGGLMITGVATLFGGNLLALISIGYGLLLAVAGAGERPRATARTLVGVLLASALMIGTTYLALG